jgi:SOS-response transcriptional repressor LexA
MVEAAIFDGDVLVVDRAISAGHGHVIMAKTDRSLAASQEMAFACVNSGVA